MNSVDSLSSSFPGGSRLCVGVSFSERASCVHGALVRADGSGVALHPRVVADVELDLGAGDAPRLPVGPVAGRPPVLRDERLVEVAVRVIGQLMARAGADRNRVLLTGLHGPESWAECSSGGRSYRGRCDPTWLAEASGLTVVDDFPSRDLAVGGRGGPLDCVALWFLLADRTRVPGRRIRALVEVAETIRFTFLPPHSLQLPRMTTLEVSPGMSLLGEIGGAPRDSTDQSGDQGRAIPVLLDRWVQLATGESEWNPQGIVSDPFVRAWRDLAERETWPTRDVIRTATQAIAITLTKKMQSCLSRSEPVGELIVSGGDSYQAGLIREIGRCLPGVAIRTCEDVGIPFRAIPPASVAVLALMHLDGIPGNPFGLTGATAARVLGRLTPGPPPNWHQVLEDIAERDQIRLPLRIAV